MASTTMFVRNNQPGPTILDEEGYETFRWEGLGDPAGGDVLPIPSDLAENYNFQRARHMGVVEVVEAEEDVKEQLQRSRDAWDRQTRRRNEISLAALGQLPTEEGSVPQEFTRPTPSVGAGPIPTSLAVEVGVNTEDDKATPKIKQARVTVVPHI